jgi:acyl carrier protein
VVQHRPGMGYDHPGPGADMSRTRSSGKSEDLHLQVTDRSVLGIIRGQLGNRRRGRPALRATTSMDELGLSRRDFAAVMATLQEEVGTEIDTVEPWEVGTVQDLVQLVNEMATAEVVAAGPIRAPVTDGDGASRARPNPAQRGHRPQARPGTTTTTVRPPTRTTSRRPQARPPSQTRTREIERPVGVRMKDRRDAGPGPIIVLRAPPSELDPSAARFRTQRRAVGSCTGQRLQMVRNAYLRAFEVCGSARNELRWLEQRRGKEATLWNAFHTRPEASLGYWFGETVPTRGNLRYTIQRIGRVIRAWTRCFDVGFRGNLPVFIRCKVAEPLAGDPAARHVARNTIELMPRFFRQAIPERRALVMLHEMGHWSIGATEPRDERYSLCTGGWNANENMCYRQGGVIGSMTDVFTGGNPRALAEAYDGGNSRAKTVALNNIDSYVSYMWNRFVDRGHSVLDVVEAGGSGKPAPSSGRTSKPVPG